MTKKNVRYYISRKRQFLRKLHPLALFLTQLFSVYKIWKLSDSTGQIVLNDFQRARLSRRLIFLAPPPTPSLSPISKLSLFLSVRRRSSLLKAERKRSRKIIRRRESLVLYKSCNTLCCIRVSAKISKIIKMRESGHKPVSSSQINQFHGCHNSR